MKKSREIIGLPVFSIEEGKEVGCVTDIIINPSLACAEFLIVSGNLKYLGLKVLPFKNLEGVGNHAITIEKTSDLASFEELPQIQELLEKDVQVKGTKVITKKGKLLGTVSEIFIDEKNKGQISGCEFTNADSSEKLCIIPIEQVITFGKDVLVVKPEAEQFLIEDPQNLVKENIGVPKEETHADEIKDDLRLENENIEENIEGIIKENVEEKTEENILEKTEVSAASLFEQRQRQFLLGRRVSKRILDNKGEVIAEEGEIINEEILDKAKAAGKLLELTMNNRA